MIICIIVTPTGQNIQAAEEKSIILLVKFETYAGVATLLEDYIKGDLTEHFKPLQDAIRGIPSYEDYTINVYISNETMFSLLNSLGLLLNFLLKAYSRLHC